MKKQIKHFSGWFAMLWCCIAFPFQYGHAAPAPVKAFPLPGLSDKEAKECCAFSLHFVNLYETKFVKKIRVSAMCETRICCADPDEWMQDNSTPEYVEWYPADSSAVPFGNAIDNEFLIYLTSQTSPYFLQVEWFDFDDNIVCRQTIEISCEGPFKEEDEDWTQYTSRTALDDERLFVFAVREEEDDEDGCEDLMKMGVCLISYSITCSGIDNYSVSLNASGNNMELYQWAVVSGPASPAINPGQNTSVILTLPGTYIIALDAQHLDTGESCSDETVIVIPSFAPNFTTARVPLPCSATIKFTPFGASDPASVNTVLWSCVGIPDFPTSCSYDGSVQYTFTAPGTYTVIVTFMDEYGCAHSVPKEVVVSFDCNAGAEVDRYYLCTGCQGESNIQVFFNNTSTGGTCPLTFTWDFGDGQPIITTNENQLSVPHTYTVPNCAVSHTYYVTLTMTDSEVNPCSSVVTIPVIIAPCRPDVTWRVCPDGKICCSSTVPGKWTFSPTLEILTNEVDEDGLSSEICVRACDEGTYDLNFEGHCSTGGRCIIQRSIVVDSLICCAKNDADRAKFDFPTNSPQYRMKYKMVQRQFIFYHKIRLKTKLKKRKTLWGIVYWKGTKADQIEAHADGTIYKSDPICNCLLPDTVDDGVIKYNKAKAKRNINIGDRFRSRLNSLISTHRVVKSGYDITKYLDLGNDCDESCN